MSEENETLRWPTNLDHAAIVERLVHVRALAEAAGLAEIGAAPDPAAKRTEIEQRIRKFASPMRGAERFDVEEIIDPRDTRRILCEFAELAAPLRTPGRSAFGIRP